MNENLQKICDKYMDYILGQLKTLLDIDSPTGYTKQVGEYLMAEYTRLGYTPGAPGRAACWWTWAAAATLSW